MTTDDEVTPQDALLINARAVTVAAQPFQHHPISGKTLFYLVGADVLDALRDAIPAVQRGHW